MDALKVKNLEDLAIAPKANAFRILDDGDGTDCFLDFLEYDQNKKKAHVVSRVQINRGFLHVLRDRMNMSLQEIPGDNPDSG